MKAFSYKTSVCLHPRQEGSTSKPGDGSTRFIVTWNTFTGSYCIHEIEPVWACGEKKPSDEMFITPDALRLIREHHQNPDVHEPIFFPSWISEQIDFYEDSLISYEIYPSIEAAKLAISQYEETREHTSSQEDIEQMEREES